MPSDVLEKFVLAKSSAAALTETIPLELVHEANPAPEALSSSGQRRKKRLEAVITDEIQQWATEKIKSRQSLLSIQLSQKGEPSLAYSYLEKELDVGGNVFKSRADIFDTILQQMVEEKIVIPGHNSIANEWRRKLLYWYEGHSEEQKLQIPIVSNTISLRRCLNKVEGMGNLKWARMNIPLVEQTFQEILADLTVRGVIDTNYKTKAERKEEDIRLREKSPKSETWEKSIDALRAIPLSHIAELVEHDPTRPFNKLFHMFAAASMGVHSVSGKKNYSDGYRVVSQHLLEIGFIGQEDPREYITPNYLPRFRNFLAEKLSTGEVSSGYADSLITSTRKMLKRALKIKGIGFSSFVDTKGFDKSRDTDTYRPYSENERKQIKDACELEIGETNELAKDYVPFRGGCDPINKYGFIENGFGTLDNARWIFENRLNCQRMSESYADHNNPYEKGFAKILGYSDKGIPDIYKSWGIIYEVTARLVAPYITRLAQITGLNADSLTSLDVDDFVECHEISRRAYLRYWKERSGGEKTLHLDLMHADVTWLSVSQSVQVKKIFQDVIYLTRHIRERANSPAKKRLFIFESRKGTEYRNVVTFGNSTVLNIVMHQFSNDHGLVSDAGGALPISASRLRPSLVAELVANGVSIREIQVILGHRNISTTVAYLDSLEFSKTALKVVDEALNRIHKEFVLDGASSKNMTSQDNERPEPSADETKPTPVSIHTGLVECRNVYDPPEEIRRLAGYKEGNPCSLLNKCLSCRNCIITVSNLPDLFAMRRDYQAIMDTSSVGSTPYGRVIRENLETLDSILTPSVQGFDAEQLAHAERLSEHIITSTLIEGMTL
jgi:integrase